MKTTTIITICVLALLSSTLQAQLQIPEGFTEVRRSIETKIDFDGDGKKDTAIIVQGKGDCEWLYTSYFLIYLTSRNKTYALKLACGIGHFTQLRVRNNTIRFGYVLHGTGVHAHEFTIRYNQREGRIQLIGFDFGHRIMGWHYSGYREVSYNLLTGDFHITNTLPFFNNVEYYPEMRIDFFRGNRRMNPVFWEDIDFYLIYLLQSVGDEFEYRMEVEM